MREGDPLEPWMDDYFDAKRKARESRTDKQIQIASGAVSLLLIGLLAAWMLYQLSE